jgi:predicted ATPase
MMVQTYQAYGFTLRELPKADVETRVAFVLGQIDKK